MAENNVNLNGEAAEQEVKKPLYSSEFPMDKEPYYDFCSVSYNRIKNVFIIFLLAAMLVYVLGALSGEYPTVIAFGVFTAIINVVTYLNTRKSVKISYERSLLTSGSEERLWYEIYDDKIVSNIGTLKREYRYSQITGLFETTKFILLHLKHNLYITINKNELNADAEEVKAFLLKKCVCVKKQKFIDSSRDHQVTVILLISQMVVSLAAAIIAVVLTGSLFF